MQGRRWEQAVEFMLLADGYSIIETHARVAGVEIDIIATDRHGEVEWIECKGSYRGTHPGLERDDTVKKLIGVAYHLWHAVHPIDRRPYVCVTSHLPRPNTLGERLVDQAIAVGALAAVRTFGHDKEASR